MAKKRKVRVAFRKNRQTDLRNPDLTRKVQAEGVDAGDLAAVERVSGKGDLSRYRTVVAEEEGADGKVVRAVDENCLPGRILTPRGLTSIVEDEQGRTWECTVRRIVRTLARDERTAVVAGDRVLFRPLEEEGKGVIERIEPRTGTLSRAVQRQRHVIAANIDQLFIVASAGEPPLKPSLIDRYLISAERGGVRPIICINKADLGTAAEVEPVLEVYRRLGYEILLTSTFTGLGVEALRALLKDRASAFSGQSGVGKSSLLNAVQPQLGLRTGGVSDWTQKGKHTTTSAQLIRLDTGGWVVDTPGIRQMELWDVAADDVADAFFEFEPFRNQCRFPDCTHSHEIDCAVKEAVATGEIAAIRYESYLRIASGQPD